MPVNQVGFGTYYGDIGTGDFGDVVIGGQTLDITDGFFIGHDNSFSPDDIAFVSSLDGFRGFSLSFSGSFDSFSNMNPSTMADAFQNAQSLYFSPDGGGVNYVLGEVSAPTTTVPAPGTAPLLATGLLGLAAFGRRRDGLKVTGQGYSAPDSVSINTP